MTRGTPKTPVAMLIISRMADLGIGRTEIVSRLGWSNQTKGLRHFDVFLATGELTSHLLKGLPGVWYTDAAKGYVADVLLDPEVFKAAVSDLDARVFKLPGISKGGGGAVVARAPLKIAGVLSVFPDIFGASQLVVGRKGKIRWADVTSAFKQAGVKAKMK